MIERLVLLRVVAEPEPVAGHDLPGIRRFETDEQSQQRRLARTVQAEHDDTGTAVDREVDVGEHLE